MASKQEKGLQASRVGTQAESQETIRNYEVNTAKLGEDRKSWCAQGSFATGSKTHDFSAQDAYHSFFFDPLAGFDNC